MLNDFLSFLFLSIALIGVVPQVSFTSEWKRVYWLRDLVAHETYRARDRVYRAALIELLNFP